MNESLRNKLIALLTELSEDSGDNLTRSGEYVSDRVQSIIEFVTDAPCK